MFLAEIIVSNVTLPKTWVVRIAIFYGDKEMTSFLAHKRPFDAIFRGCKRHKNMHFLFYCESMLVIFYVVRYGTFSPSDFIATAQPTDERKF